RPGRGLQPRPHSQQPGLLRLPGVLLLAPDGVLMRSNQGSASEFITQTSTTSPDPYTPPVSPGSAPPAPRTKPPTPSPARHAPGPHGSESGRSNKSTGPRSPAPGVSPANHGSG